MTNLSIRTKLYSLAASMLATLFVVGLLGVFHVDRLTRELSGMGTVDLPVVGLAANIGINVNDEKVRYERSIGQYYAARANVPGAREALEAAVKDFDRVAFSSDDHFDALRKVISKETHETGGDDRAGYAGLERRIEAIHEAQVAYETQARRVFKLLRDDQPGDLPAAAEQAAKAVQAAETQLAEFSAAVGKMTQDGLERDRATGRIAMLEIVVLVLAVVCGGAAFSWWLARGIIGPVHQAMAVAGRIRDGDLSQPIVVDAGGEMGQLLATLHDMQDALTQVVGSVRANAEGVATASAQIAQGNGDLSGRTEQQASALQQTAASMEQLGSTVRQNADHARQANQLAQGASAAAGKGGEVVGEVVQTMKRIDESSKKIADIISVIDGIAFQTNILALNAAVEAARAGEQGRGFAVVASEVRSLAQRSAAAAREIKALISASVERVEQGTVLVGNAGGTMGEIVSAIRRVTDIISEISAASQEQSSGVAQIGDAVSAMDQATQQNAALVEESAAAAESLKLQARQLVQAVAVFRLAGTVEGEDARHDMTAA